MKSTVSSRKERTPSTPLSFLTSKDKSRVYSLWEAGFSSKETGVLSASSNYTLAMLLHIGRLERELHESNPDKYPAPASFRKVSLGDSTPNPDMPSILEGLEDSLETDEGDLLPPPAPVRRRK